MYITINEVTYQEINELNFAPQIDITNDSVPVNTLSVDINTEDDIAVGGFVYLYDDLDQLWAKYWITYTDRKDLQFLHLEAQSIVGLLDRKILKATIYTSATQIGSIINSLFSSVAQVTGETCHEIESGAETKTIKGYFPKQTARERLQWICFATNLCIQQAFTDKVQIKTLNQNSIVNIPITRTYWKPTITFKDYVTSIKLTAYSFTAGTPVSGDDYVKVNGTTYIRTEYEYELTNNEAPASAVPNEIEIDGVFIVHSGNVDDILSRLALLYFARSDIDAAIINNKEYMPGQKITIPLDSERDATGYIDTESFSFGVQAKSKIKIVASEIRGLKNLTIHYMYKTAALSDKKYSFPIGYQYQITNPFLDKTSNDDRFIYRPVNKYATGTIVSGSNVNTQQTEIALRYNSKKDTLLIISVSTISYDSSEKVVTIG